MRRTQNRSPLMNCATASLNSTRHCLQSYRAKAGYVRTSARVILTQHGFAQVFNLSGAASVRDLALK